MKTRSLEMRVRGSPIALKFDRRLSSNAADEPVKCKSEMIILPFKLMSSTSWDLEIRRIRSQ